MPRRQLKPKQAIDQEKQTALSERPLAIIARQSSTRQTKENLESLKLQVDDARQRFIDQGWSEDIITIRVAGGGKRGVSGTLRIDQRSELQDTLADAKAGKIKAIGAYSVSRLFRDKYGVQVGTFMEVCAEHDILVILPNRVYDFSDSNDRLIFKLEAEFAAKDNELRTKLLSEARLRKSMRGEYDGRTLSVGFIVDRAKTLPDGKPNPTYGHFIPYEPHAKVVRFLYRRYRELGGRFNLLAAEVARMDVVFPDFEEWVSKLDKARLRLEKVPGGYRISREGLFSLLTAVEYAGYWKVHKALLTDVDGKPLKVHEAIVGSDDWEYAWRRLSWTTLTGEKNVERVVPSNSWIPATKGERKTPRGLLSGILTSPLGTVQNTNGMYRVTEQKDDCYYRTNTLTVSVDRIDTIFAIRRAERLQEMERMGRGDFLQKQLKLMQETNKKALVSVDKQIARYRNEIAGIQAYIKAVGAKADKKTLQEYNEQLLDLRANLEALEAKKNAAEVEENSFKTFVRRMQQLMFGKEGHEEDSRRFIELICEKIELGEYSSHFMTLTIRWREPFAQTDVCYMYRETGGHHEWTEEDERDLARLYPQADRKDIMARFPKCSWMAISKWATRRLGLTRQSHLNTTGITDSTLSLRDYELLTGSGWCKEDLSDWKVFRRDEYWLYDVKKNNDAVTTLSHLGRYW